MKTLKALTLFIFLMTLIVSCGNMNTVTRVSNGNNPYSPRAGDASMQRDEITIDSSSLSLSESEPQQVTLNFAYFSSTPCHQLRVEISDPGAQNRIDVTTYSVVEKNKACTLMALATPLTASLNLGGFPKGHYSVWLNEVLVDEFDS